MNIIFTTQPIWQTPSRTSQEHHIMCENSQCDILMGLRCHTSKGPCRKGPSFPTSDCLSWIFLYNIVKRNHHVSCLASFVCFYKRCCHKVSWLNRMMNLDYENYARYQADLLEGGSYQLLSFWYPLPRRPPFLAT